MSRGAGEVARPTSRDLRATSPDLRTRSPELVPADDVASRSFAGVIAILAFLAALAAAAAATLSGAAAGWRTTLAAEATLQVLPRTGRDLAQDVERAAALARATPGIAAADALSKGEADALLAPWFGEGVDLGDLPAPRLVVLKLDPGRAPDLAGLRARLAAELPSARLDDHAGWLAHLAGAARAVVWGAFALVGLIIGAAALAVAFATRGALAANRRTVEVLHWVGADDRFIARAFALRFVRLGLAGAAAGAAAAALAAAAIGPALRAAGAGGEGGEALVGAVAVGWPGFAGIVLVAAALSLVSGLASFWGVKRFLRDERRT